MISSVDKTIHYLDAVSKRKYHVEFAGTSYDITGVEEFGIRPSMFCRDECLSCGQCCRNYDTVMFPTDSDEIKTRAQNGQEPYQFLLDNSTEYPLIINGKEYSYISVPPMTAKDSHDIWCDRHTVLNCRWIFLEGEKKYCKIHEYRCITCGFPHMELYQNRTRTHGYLGHKQFGRNHQLGCKVDITRPLDKETLQENLYWLNRLKVVADYLQMDTFLPEIIQTLDKIDIDDVPEDTIYFKNTTKVHKLFKI